MTTTLATRPATELPAPVSRWVETAELAKLADVATIMTAGTGRVRLGRLPWLPMDHRTVHRLGRDQVRDIRLRVGPIPVLRVLDAYVDTSGITRIGPMPIIGPDVDQGAFLAMWAEAIQWPSSWSQAAGLEWQAIDDEHARVQLPFGSELIELELTFDPASSFPNAYEVDRPKGRGRNVRWRADFSELRHFGAVSAWSRVFARWLDEEDAWYEARIERLDVNVPVESEIRRARAAIAGAGRRRRRL